MTQYDFKHLNGITIGYTDTDWDKTLLITMDGNSRTLTYEQTKELAVWLTSKVEAFEKDVQALDADAQDMARIKAEWRAYRTQGDETPPTPPSQLL